ncbi:hypothetical protein [Flavobacterium sp.]|uniref:hypothetical protein n=1 Tax=Flavobacterium sp. TaxID=239 RepID=UPI0040472324
MTKRSVYILISIVFVSCNVHLKEQYLNFQEERVIISKTSGKDFSFKSENENLICLAFLNEFKDSIVVLKNKKKILDFYRNDTISYMKMDHSEIFKTLELNNKGSVNEIQIFLLKEKVKIKFNLIESESLYLISRYNRSWYITMWENQLSQPSSTSSRMSSK